MFCVFVCYGFVLLGVDFGWYGEMLIKVGIYYSSVVVLGYVWCFCLGEVLVIVVGGFVIYVYVLFFGNVVDVGEWYV